jgi:hypothetical protein
MSGIYLSYRRMEAGGHAGRLADAALVGWERRCLSSVARHDTYWTGHPEGPTPGSKFANKSSVDSPSGIPR